MKLNKRVVSKTHEGALAAQANPFQELQRTVLTCMLWENSFYEDGQSVAGRIQKLVPQVSSQMVASLAIQAREEMKLRHVPLLIVREMARHDGHKSHVSDTLERIIQRPDEMAEFLAIYWNDGRQPLSAQVKKGLARAFVKFNEYQLAKYDRSGRVKLKDVLFLCHAKPKNKDQEAMWGRLISGNLASPETWENQLSAGKDKRQVWESMLAENKLGALALIRNLRNMEEAGVSENLIFDALENIRAERVLPFRFISAAKHAPQWEPQIESAMLKCLAGREKLAGRTVLLVDVSGSMNTSISSNSELMRFDAANGLAILARELCEYVEIFSFSSNLVRVPPRRGFALRDAIASSQPHMMTAMGAAISEINKYLEYDRIIVLTDEQAGDVVPDPTATGYIINVAAYKNGVGYGKWTTISGWSEAVFDYITALESNG
ncbi:MAG: TROVE domain-containing protein [Anaerolineales bacterium]|nr:TROVE domain-containing protein [Anaerolineales bacterium]